MFDKNIKDEELNKILYTIEDLHEYYKNALIGRKELIEAIKKYISLVKKKTSAYNSELKEIEDFYSYRDYYIRDYKQVMRLLLRLANQNNDIYGMKEIVAIDFVNIDNVTKQLYGKTMIISNKDVLNKIHDDKLYYYDEFSKVSEDIINNGYSIIIVTYNYFDGNVKPKNKLNEKVERVDIKNSGMIGNISCYLHDDDLKKAVNKLIEFININGPDFSNIDEETLYKMICNNNEKQLVKIK